MPVTKHSLKYKIIVKRELTSSYRDEKTRNVYLWREYSGVGVKELFHIEGVVVASIMLKLIKNYA